MSVAALDGHLPAVSAARSDAPAAAMNPRTRLLLQGPILPTLLRMAWPNVLVMVAQAATGVIETWFVAKLGTDALAGMALVFPGVMLMQMISAGAMGGGISSAIARALGAGRRDQADALVMHALIINIALGLTCSAIMLAFGRPIYRALGGEGAALEAALAYSNVVFAGNVLLWVLNGFASVIRGTGNMLVPASVICAGVVVLLPLSPVLIFGLGPFPALGIAGGGVALLLFYAAGTAVLTWYILSGRNVARLRPSPLRWPLFRDILGVGAVAAVTSVQTNVIIALATALVVAAGGAAAAAGYGTAARLEYLLVPLVFGLGAPLVAMVGTNIGAGQRARALRIAMAGGAVAFAATEAIGVAAAVWPQAWIGRFSTDPHVLATGTTYLRIVGPTYGFFGLALALYFASQGAGRLFWPLSAGFLRMLVAIGGGWLALRATGSLLWLFAALALGLFLHGMTLLIAIGSGAWFGRPAPGRSAGVP
jgi:putative MATE family efflux protein